MAVRTGRPAVLANPDRLMAPGFFARVRIPGIAEYDAVLIRDSAISSDQGRLFVLTVDDQTKTVYRPIKIGPIIDGLRVVREGLAANDRVIVSGYSAESNRRLRRGRRSKPSGQRVS